MTQKLKGTVKSLNSQKKFGFIFCNGHEYFFHREDFNGHWDDLVHDFDAWPRQKKIEVEFEEVFNPKGPRAANVKRLDYPNQAT